MKRHRASCPDWANRADPRGLSIARRTATRKAQKEPRTGAVPLCICCKKRVDHHEFWCHLGQTETSRRELLAKHAIPPEVFEVFLGLLKKKRESGC
jgi:hypothetical protein